MFQAGSFPFPVIETLPRASQESRAAIEPHSRLARVRIVDDFRGEHRAHREVLEIRSRRRIDDLVRQFRSARRTGDEVAAPERMTPGADAQFAFAFEHEEHLLVDAVVVQRKGALAGRQDRDVVAELARADARRNLSELRGETLAVTPVLEFDVVEVEDRMRHCCLHASISARCAASCSDIMTGISQSATVPTPSWTPSRVHSFASMDAMNAILSSRARRKASSPPASDFAR